ncbi:MAG: hypothetical protein COT55_02340 [Candidatus Diapherotrites archaeon CG09_land_8_20_14_0_10_32_12]|nr:MAG: hypothetical protein COT55_02340 [Candidatus Diapherotrites archaeon CG09_land_8_20_14_0_10_32_12]
MIKFLKDHRGQASIEILIGVVIVIVIATLVGLFLKKSLIKPQEQGADLIDKVSGDIGGK